MNTKSMKSIVDSITNEDPKLKDELKDMQPRIELTKALYKLRQDAELTQKQVAESMGVDQSFVSRMESVNGAFPNNDSIASYVHACHAVGGYVFVSEADRGTMVSVPMGVPEDREIFSETMEQYHIENT